MFSLISREFGKGQTGKGTTFSRAAEPKPPRKMPYSRERKRM
jgi:hypothetical protein